MIRRATTIVQDCGKIGGGGDRFMTAMIERALAGERKFVSVMFVDIVNSSALVDAIDPEEANSKILPKLHLASGAVLRHGGTIAQILGDGVLAVFGAPAGLEDHARRACASAFEILCTASELGIRDTIRIGISSGEVVIERGVNNELRSVGEPVYLAARAQQSATPGQITITGQTSALLNGEYLLRPTRDIHLVPGGRISSAFELRQRAARVTPAVDQRTPFVGRQTELKVLSNALTQARQGEGVALAVLGEAGIGKTRLVSEFTRQLPPHEARIVRIWLAPREHQTPYGAIAELFSGCLQLSHPERSAHSDLMFLVEMLGITGDQNLSPAVLRRLVVRRAAARIIQEARSRCLVIVVEDAHRLDSTLALLLQDITPRFRAARIMLLLTARRAGIQCIDFLQSAVMVEPLSSRDARVLSTFLLSNSRQIPSPAAVDSLCAKGQGNPYFLAECAEIANASDWRQSGAAFTPPATIRTLLSERIDRLAPGVRSILLAMSVIGETVDVQILGGITNRDSKRLLRALTVLIERGFVYQARVLPRIEYKFHHSLVRDVAYATLLKTTRRRLHCAVYEALRNAPRTERANAQLAFHAFHARKFRKAYVFSLRDGLERKRASQNVESRDRFEMALRSLRHHQDNRKTRRRTADVSLLLAAVLSAMGEHLQAREHLNKALRGARALGDRRRSVKAFSDVMLMQWMDGKLPRACASGRLAQRLSAQEHLSVPWVRATVRLGMVLSNCGAFERAVEVLRSTLPELGRHSEFEAFGLLGSGLSGVRAALCAACSELGEVEDALVNGVEAVELAGRSRHPFSRIYANVYFANMLLINEEYLRAKPILEEAVALCEDTGTDVLYPLAVSMLANVMARTDAGDVSVLPLWNRLQPLPIPTVRSRRALGAHWMGEAFLLTGRPDQAEEIARAAEIVASSASEMAELAWTIRLRGEIALRRGSWRAAIAHFSHSKRLAYGRNMAPLVRRCESGVRRARSEADLHQKRVLTSWLARN